MNKKIKKTTHLEKPICLFDMDGVLCDYDRALEQDMALLASPNEPKFKSFARDNEPSYIRARMDMIKKNTDWWAYLPTIDSGMGLYRLFNRLGFRTVVLTQGPRINADAWKGKLMWCRRHLQEDTDVIITRDKGLVYGKILVDDWPPYVESWLKHRPRGTVIMPAQPWNEGFKHKQVIRYTATEKEYDAITKKLKAILRNFKGE